MHITFQLYDVLRFDATVVIYVIYQYIIPKANKYFKVSQHRVQKYASGLPQRLRLNHFAVAKRRNFIGQNKVKICKLSSQNFKFSGKKFGCPTHNQ